MKRHDNAGKREREARKRRRRARVWTSSMGAEAAPLKLGRKHMQRWWSKYLRTSALRREFHAVADAEKPGVSVR